jgi:prepilin-type N-terminal cleavage/methylation domain-containing protein
MKKRGFTLLELMIVIVIIGVIYGVAISSMKKSADRGEVLTLDNMYEYLTKFRNNSSVKIVSIDKCKESYLFVDDLIQDVQIEPFMGSDCNVYEIDQFFGVKKVEFGSFFTTENVEKDICFEYMIDKYGGSKELIVECKEKVFLLANRLFKKSDSFDNLSDILEAKEKLFLKVQE